MTHADWPTSADPLAMLAWLGRCWGDDPAGGPSYHVLGPRRTRLFAVACVRTCLRLGLRGRGGQSPLATDALACAERHADGSLPDAGAASRLARAILHDADGTDIMMMVSWSPAATTRAYRRWLDVIAASLLVDDDVAAMLPQDLRTLAALDAHVNADRLWTMWGDVLRDFVTPCHPVVTERDYHTSAFSHALVQHHVQEGTHAAPLPGGRAGRLAYDQRLRRHILPERCRTADVVSLAHGAYDLRGEDAGLDPMRLGILSDALEEADCTITPLLAHLRDPAPHWRGCWALDLLLGRRDADAGPPHAAGVLSDRGSRR